MASGLNLTTGRIEEEGMYGGYPSAASSSTGETGDSRTFSSFYTRIPGTSRTSRDVIQEQESFLAVTNDISTPEVLPPSINQELETSFAGTYPITEPSNEETLHHSFVLDNTLARNYNPYAWNSFDALNAHHVHGGPYGTQTAYQASNLDVPMDISRRTSSALGSLSAPTSGGLSDTVSAVSQGYVDTRHKARPRGGRRTGMHLTDESVKNSRQVREEGGACMRCNALKETCSIGNPCENCLKTQPRIWDGCTRSFEELIDIFKPEILAIRLKSEPLTRFMVAHTSRSYNQHYFDLPLHFGFGKTFNGFKGAEYYPKSSESQYSHAVGSTAEYRDSARYEPSLPVYPTNSNTYETRELVINWLNETLKSGADMENWLTACFGARDVEWVRKLLRTAWKYSVRLWNEPQRVGQDEDQLGENLIYAWFLALLTTMLSFQVTIPSDALPGVMENLQPLAPGHKCSNTSRPINKCVKSLFFNLYSRSVEKVMSALQAFKDTTNPEKLSERDLCHIHCMTILIVVTTAYLQTSLMDDYRFIDPEITDLREKTFNYIREVERAFKNTVLHVRQRSKDWLKYVSSRDGGAPNQVSQFLNGINEIERTYTKDISTHRKVKLKTLLDHNLSFHHSNIQRLFAFYFIILV